MEGCEIHRCGGMNVSVVLHHLYEGLEHPWHRGPGTNTTNSKAALRFVEIYKLNWTRWTYYVAIKFSGSILHYYSF